MTIALALSMAVRVPAGGFQGFRAYTGPKLPKTAAPFVYVPTNRFTSDDPEALGYWLDTDGDAHVDAVDVALLHQRDFGLQVVWGAYVSPSDPDVYYVLGEPPDGSAPPFGLRIVVVRRVGETFVKVGGPYILPAELQQNGDWLDTPPLRRFSGDWVHPIAFRRIAGKDVVLVVRLIYSRRAFESRYCLLVDGNGDEFADTFTPVETKSDVDPMTIDDRGNVYARHPLDNSEPYGYCDRFDRLVDTDGDTTPDTVDGSVPISRMPFQEASVTTGMADVDTGFDRFYVASVGYVNLDSWGRMIPGSVGDQDDIHEDGFLDPYNSVQLFTGHDGYLMSYVDADVVGDYGIATWGDFDFNGLTDNYATAPLIEIRPVFYEHEVDPNSFINNVSVADLEQISLDHGGAAVTFRDHGEYEYNESFTFRYGSTDFDQLWVGANGIVSFAGPVTVASSTENLARLHGVIAPAWSSDWDTSNVRVHAGYVPIQMSIRDGHPVKAFAIEWRGLRRPGWEANRGVAMRLILYEDGAWRTDFGAFEPDDLGDLSFVSGYAGPGSLAATASTDVSAHSWGAGPAGTGAERVVAEAFGPSNLTDLGHKFVRWNGYPDRLDTPGTIPQLISPVLRNGKKISMKSRGSGIANGAVLIVDGGEVFRLAKNAAGSKWIVSTRTTSQPGLRTVASIWSDGAAHRIAVVNPDGEVSASVELR